MTKSAETYCLVHDLRNALAAAMRVLIRGKADVDTFLAETRQVGIKDGIGVRADNWLKKNPPTKPCR